MEKFITEPTFHPVDFDPFAGPPIACTAPTTEAQREVWVASQMSAEASCAYIESVSLDLHGELDPAAMERTIHQLVERHEGLRSTISANGMRVIVLERMDLPFTFVDLSGLNETARQRELDALAHRDMHTAFDLLRGPLFRVYLVRLSNDHHLLRLSGHHVIVDGWSLGIIMADVSRFYTALKRGTPPDLPEVFRFSDYAIAQIDLAKSPEHERVERYWLDLFKDGAPVVDLPTDRPRPKLKTYNGHRLDLELDPGLVRDLRATATRSGASFVTTLLTAFEVLLYKLTGQSDLVVGLPAAGQSDMGMKDLVGHCVNLLALRSRIDEDQSFIDHLKARRTAVLDAFDHQKYTFGTLVHKLNVQREPGRIPLCPVVFNIDMNMDDGVAFEGLRHRFISNPRAFENFELFLNATGSDEALVLEWSYNTDLFNASTVRGWMDQLSTLVSRIAAAPSATIADLLGDTVLTGEQRMPLPEWTGRSVPYPKVDIATLFDEVAARHADRTAVELLDQRLTYAELQRRVHDLSRALVHAGVKPGNPVGLCMDRGFDMVVSMLAIARAGGCFVPFDPSYPEERLTFMLADTSVRVMLTQRHLTDALPKHNARVMVPSEVKEAAPATMPKVDADSPVYIMYTSGSTGRPKGVVVPHRAVVRLVREQNFLPFGPDLTFLQLSNISFDASTLEIWGALLNGGRLVLQPQQKPTLPEIKETIRRHKVTSAWFTAGLFNLMVDEQLDGLRGLKHIVAGGDVLSVPHVRKALKALGPNVLINGYGPTENTTFTCCYPIRSEKDIADGVPIGVPLHNTTVYVLDEQRNPVPVGRKGELYTGGDGVALGYWNRPDLTAERFIDDPFSGKSGAKLYRTGDIVRWQPDGTIAFIGRADGQVKVRGFRIELGEVENALNGLTGVKDRVVTVRQDGPGEKQLACYVVPIDPKDAKDGSARDRLLGRVREHLRATLPGYMVPTAFMVLEELPLSPNGKVDRKSLPPPTQQPSTLKAEHVAPRNAMEKTLVAIWKEALGVADLGVHDNFFDLGGHSLIGIQVLSQVEQQLGQKLALNALFQAPTVARFAEALKELAPGGTTQFLAPVQKTGSKTPLFCVHGDEANYFLSRDLGTDQPFYAFFHQGEDGYPLRYTTVEEIAARFIEELRTVRPHGPYLLCGFSFGGLVAYEMAQQLTAQGEQVPFLALFDTYAPALYDEVMRAETKWHEPLKNAVMRRLVRYHRRRGKPLPPKLRHFHIIDTYNTATKHYAIRPYHGPMMLIKAEASPGPEAMGWDSLVKGKLTLALSPGDHYNMIKDPHVKTLSAHVERGIEQALHAARAVVG
jgi:amino acid adenylation domain-containing protein